MGWLGKIDDWLVRRKQEAAEKQVRNPFDKKHKRLRIMYYFCKECGHDKAFLKGNVLKCTKCGNRTRK